MAILAIRLKKEVSKLKPDIKAIKLVNVTLKGRKCGCNGYFLNPENGRVVFVDTEEIAYGSNAGMVLVRYSGSATGCSGEDEYVKPEYAAEAIVKMLTSQAPVSFRGDAREGE